HQAVPRDHLPRRARVAGLVLPSHRPGDALRDLRARLAVTSSDPRSAARGWLGGGRTMTAVTATTSSALDTVARVLTCVVAVGTGLMAGMYFAFSSSVMQALDDLAPSDGTAVMQSINRAVPNPVFLLVFLGTALGCVALAVVALVRWGDPASPYQLAG